MKRIIQPLHRGVKFGAHCITQRPRLSASIAGLLLVILVISWAVDARNFDVTQQNLNIPTHAKQQATKPEVQGRWVTETVTKGTTVDSIFKRENIPEQTLQAIMALGKTTQPLAKLHIGDQIKLFISPNNELLELQYPVDITDVLTIKYQNHSYQASIIKRKLTERLQFADATIKHSLYDMNVRGQLNNRLIAELTRIFSWDVNFAKQLRPGAEVKVLYQEYYLDGKKVHDGNIVAAELINNKKTYTAIRYTNTKGVSEYYTPKGINLQKAILRAPVHYNHISSSFTLRRYHPILHIYRPHYGVDYAAPAGTPIEAAGDGKITFIGYQRGYGNTIVIRHNSKYTTLYGHMKGFAKHLKRGSHVKQGQTIGYVGSTGLATGPHLHFEIHTKGTPHNPRTVKLPNSAPVPKVALAAFKARASKLLAQMDLQHQSVLASKQAQTQAS